MQLCSFTVASLLSFGAFVSAAPLNARKDYCATVVDVIYILKGPLKNKADFFCSSYLGGPKTTTVVKTATVIGAIVTATTTLPAETTSANASVTVVTTVVSTVSEPPPNPTVTATVTETAGTRTIYQRGLTNVPVPVPQPLRPFVAFKISQACSCIVVLPTTTAHSTITQSVAGSTVTETLPGQTLTVTYTTTIQSIVELLVTQTIPAAGTETTTVATTVTPILVKPKICNARGLPGANAFNYDANFNTNQANCIASCKGDARCLSTGFYIVTDPSSGTQTGTCRKYDKSVTDSADLGSGYYNWNDKAC